jgi:hypothetical protein
MHSIWFSDVALLIVLLVTSELLYRVGRASRRRGDENVKSQVSTAQASTLGLLALFLGFTMSMAESRFTARRQIVVKEAAAVGTTYLRADILPEPVRSQSKALLRDYVAARRDYFHASASEAPAATARAQALHVKLWSAMDSVVPEVVDSDVTALYVESLNEMIDLEAIREVAIVARLPWTIRFLLVIIAVIAVGVTAYATGLGGGRVPLSLLLLPLLIAFTVYVIIDLDRSRAGFINTGDMPMMRLQQTLNAAAS